VTDTRQSTPSSSGDAVPEAETARERGISIIWLVPIVAAAIGAWLAYTAWQEQGPTITIRFADAEGLEAGKTQIKYKDVEIGLVEDVHISDDLAQIVVTAEMTKEAAHYLSEGTRFWVVSPRLGAGGVSGLGTLLSGVYIGVDPKPGELVDEFEGLAEPPLIASRTAGRQYVLRAASRGSIARGSPIYFRGIQVGQVVDYALADDDQSIDFKVFIRAPHHELVYAGSRFWNASGFQASIGADGVRVGMESIQSLLAGGIAFDTPVYADPGEPSPDNTVFVLHPDFASVSEARFTQKIPYTIFFDDSVRGLSPGAPVEFRGMRVGTVKGVQLEIDVVNERIRIPVNIEIEPERITMIGGTERDPDMMAEMVKRGLRAQLQSGNLLTGQLLVDLNFHPKAPAAELGHDGAYPVIPSVPSELEALTASVTGIMTDIAALPLDELVQELRNTVESINQITNSDNATQTLDALNASAVALQAVLQNLNQQLGPLMSQARGTLASAEAIVGPESPVRYDLNAMLKELTGAARSIRVFADYLERHPEALIRGKPGFASQ